MNKNFKGAKIANYSENTTGAAKKINFLSSHQPYVLENRVKNVGFYPFLNAILDGQSSKIYYLCNRYSIQI
jgi:hypothetical protein